MDRKIRYPPVTAHTMKVFYVTREFIRRRIRVDWIFPGHGTYEGKNDVGLVSIPVPSSRFLNFLFFIIRLLEYCKRASISYIYLDEWLFFRGKPERVLLLGLALRIFRIRFVFDQRDPLIDFWVATGKIREGGRRHTLLRLLYQLIYRAADLIILPSRDFSNEIAKQNIPRQKVFGMFRGIDFELFDPVLKKGRSVRRSLNLQGKFVIGWFGIMNEYRQIREVVIPIIESIDRLIPNSHVVMAGKGRLKGELVKLKERKPDLPLTLLDFVNYHELPEYFAGCDVLLCPLDTRFRFVRLGLPLKIIESLGMGKPIVATQTPGNEREFKNLRGIAWSDGTLDSFVSELKNISTDTSPHRLSAQEQARDPAFRKGPHSISSTVPRIVNRILKTG